MKNIKSYHQLFESNSELSPDQIKFLNRYVKGIWTLNLKTGLVDVDGDFDCNVGDRTTFENIKFGNVSGNFHFTNHKITSLIGAPHTVGKSFYCTFNRITSLEGAPKTVGGDFNCMANQLRSLEGSPEKIGGSFYCRVNPLTTLKGAPKQIGGDFECDAFSLGYKQWNSEGWVEKAQESDDNFKLLIPLLPEDYVAEQMLKNPLDLDLLNPFPDLKAKVLKRTGLKDISKLAAMKRQGLI